MNLTFLNTMRNMNFNHTLLTNPIYLFICHRQLFINIFLTGLQLVSGLAGDSAQHFSPEQDTIS